MAFKGRGHPEGHSAVPEKYLGECQGVATVPVLWWRPASK